jgi:hypothetical protein
MANGKNSVESGAAMTDEERELWSLGDAWCVMISCCSGAELQVRRSTRPGRSKTEHPDSRGAREDRGFEIVLRELYPTKGDLYERARELECEYRDRVNTS